MRRTVLLSLAAILAVSVVPSAGAAGFSAPSTPLSKDMRKAMTGVSWHKGCPVGLNQLRLITPTYHTPDGGVATGQLIVNRDVAPAVVRVFKRLWDANYPIARMDLVDAYGGDDWQSIEANNTSAFNCRAATGSSHWSNHAYGRAIDINPIENPWVESGKVFHKASWQYVDRTKRKSPSMILPGDRVVKAFATEGWGWGGAWTGGTLDLQHFSPTGH